MDARATKRIPITEFLDALGHQPKSVRGTSYWYVSPFRNEKTPSFKVEASRNVWYDHGEGIGGTIIDLAMRIYGNPDVATAIRTISSVTRNGAGLGAAPTEYRLAPLEKPKRASSTAESVSPLADPELVRYLEEVRAIPLSAAAKFVREISYRTAEGKRYSAIAFPNRSGGYELRSAAFKGTYGTKDITIVGDPQAESVRVFEGFSDFLSAQVLWPDECEKPALILNSVALAEKGANELLSRGCTAVCFFDADLAGSRALATFQEILGKWKAADARVRLGESKDVNELLVARRDARE